ncbi:NAD-dependent epimerase/dehydratase family protein [Pedobacter aquatilis]|uniref:NAD-dependent epimerase/dehydratase family protein n=1 Tax=Pedobacter aquatilis TaxID=351343 RepID=UPI00292D3D88|nr:NAD-dependent epimerase/dehydratase family protein [Pedobacter aquatilis]
MKVLLTGATGFLGNYIYSHQIKQNKVITISRSGSNINVDLAERIPNIPAVDLVIHCAGKAHSVPKTLANEKVFFDVNLKGTANLLSGIENNEELPQAFVFISSVAVYGCDTGKMINEDHPLNATDPYGKSKIQAEELIKNWCVKNKVTCVILRLPLLVGDNPPGNLGAMIKGIERGYYINIGGGKAKKSMVFAEDVAKIIELVAKVGGVYNLTDGYHPSFAELSNAISIKLNKKKPFNIPIWIAKILSVFGNALGSKAPINTAKLNKIVSDLTFDDSKARQNLNWKPSAILNNFNI